MMAKTDRLRALAAVVGLLAAAGLLMALMMLVFEVKPAEATFPGKNGKIAYDYDGIYTINPGGRGKTHVTQGSEPSFSPNGKRIAYRASEGHDPEIYTIGVGGGNRVQLTNNKTYDYDPSWSPNGKRIAYSGVAEKSERSLRLALVEATGSKSLITTSRESSTSHRITRPTTRRSPTAGAT